MELSGALNEAMGSSCVVCKLVGATVQCSMGGCRKRFHLPCTLKCKHDWGKCGASGGHFWGELRGWGGWVSLNAWGSCHGRSWLGAWPGLSGMVQGTGPAVACSFWETGSWS